MSANNTDEIKYYRLAMVRDNLLDLPCLEIPTGYSLKLFEEHEIGKWADIETSVGEFTDSDTALKHFDEEFSPHIEKMKKRCLFLMTDEGRHIGTTTAWYGEFNGEKQGRIHWVAIKPEFQGKGLAKPMFAKAMNILSCYHDKAYLTTQTTSWKGIAMYLSYGFKPAMFHEKDEGFIKGWPLVYEKIKNEKRGAHE